MRQTDSRPPILNRHVPNPPWREPRARSLPGIQPFELDDWFWVLDTYGEQMAERERLLRECSDQVHALPPEALGPAQELFDMVVAQLDGKTGFRRDGATMHCPDGRAVALERSAPLMTLGRLVQEDLCILQKPDGATEHLLSGAVLCFPASWTLAQKIGRPLLAIHIPVAAYDQMMGRRVQRLLDGIQPGRPMRRSNTLFYDDPTLYQPRCENDPRPVGGPDAPFFRSERQCLVRLPDTGAVVFSIHTIVLRREDMSPEDRVSPG